MTRVAWFVAASVLSLPLVARADQPLRSPLYGEHQQDWSLLDREVVTDVAFPPAGATPEPVNHAAVSNIIYLNRCVGGCTLTRVDPPRSNALTNETSIIGGSTTPAGTEFHITEFRFAQPVWDEFVQCMKDVYAPYNVQIVTDDPSPTPHHEAIVAGTAAEYGKESGVLGTGQLGAGFCSPRDNAISINMANDHTPAAGMSVAQNICWTVAQETAHTWVLDHELECSDALTYIFTSSGRPLLRKTWAYCREFP